MMNHAPGAGSIARPDDQPRSTSVIRMPSNKLKVIMRNVKPILLYSSITHIIHNSTSGVLLRTIHYFYVTYSGERDTVLEKYRKCLCDTSYHSIHLPFHKISLI